MLPDAFAVYGHLQTLTAIYIKIDMFDVLDEPIPWVWKLESRCTVHSLFALLGMLHSMPVTDSHLCSLQVFSTCG